MKDKSFKSLKKLDIIEIDWIDSMHQGGWTHEKDYKPRKEDLYHKTCGYFLQLTEEGIVVIQSRSMDAINVDAVNIDAIMEIPRVAVKKLKKLK